MPKVVITMPAYRAEATLERTLADIPAGIADELILVDDASPDGTAALARALGIKVHVHDQNRGYGGNQKTCYTEALRDGADIVVMLHPDYQYDPKAVPLLIAPILAGDADMTFGSRFAGMSNPRDGGMPLFRYAGNRLTTLLENMILGTRFTEMHSGMRAYTRGCLLRSPFLGYSDDFVFDSQFLVDAVTSRKRVIEVPIPTRYTKESSSISIARSLRYVAGSISYCAGRTRARGRRGEKMFTSRGSPSPVGTGADGQSFDLRRSSARFFQPPAPRCVTVGSPESDDATAVSTSAVLAGTAQVGPADVVLIETPLDEIADASRLLAWARGTLQLEGLLGFSYRPGTGDGVPPIREMLLASRFDPIDETSSGGQERSAFARPAGGSR